MSQLFVLHSFFESFFITSRIREYHLNILKLLFKNCSFFYTNYKKRDIWETVPFSYAKMIFQTDF